MSTVPTRGEPIGDRLITTINGLSTAQKYHTHWCYTIERATDPRPATDDEVERYRMIECRQCQSHKLDGLEL